MTAPSRFRVISGLEPAGHQPDAIARIVRSIGDSEKFITLRGVTGSGKTYVMAKIIEQVQRPTLVISHNKTLAAQLYSELKGFMPENAVEYFVSIYDYYQPEAYLPASDTYVQKTVDINPDLEKLRYAATSSLMTREDVVIVSSVSCIYGIGISPERFMSYHIPVRPGDILDIDELLERLVQLQYERSGAELLRGTFRFRGELLDIFPPGMDTAFRIGFVDDEVESVSIIHPLTGRTLEEPPAIVISPAKYFITDEDERQEAFRLIREELALREEELKEQGRVLEAFRLHQRTNYDLEMIETVGWCTGIENYSRYLSDRGDGDAPYTLMDYLPKNALVIVDESHVTLPQIRGMPRGDHSRKRSLIENGFRLPSAYDNRPLNFDEWEERVHRVLFTSATPGDYELEHSKSIVEMIVRPTGLLDPLVDVRPTEGAVDDLVHEIHITVEGGDKVLVTVMTKKMAEELAEYLGRINIRVAYLHSGIDTLDRIALLERMQSDEFDVLVGINLLREGLDMPLVSLVAIMDADQEGFLRSTTSLIQTIGRAARNVNGRVIMYADRVTASMKAALDDNRHKRIIQENFNHEHGITPTSIQGRSRSVDGFERYHDFNHVDGPTGTIDIGSVLDDNTMDGITDALEGDQSAAVEIISKLEGRMRELARAWEFEKAALVRDKIIEIQERMGE